MARKSKADIFPVVSIGYVGISGGMRVTIVAATEMRFDLDTREDDAIPAICKVIPALIALDEDAMEAGDGMAVLSLPERRDHLITVQKFVNAYRGKIRNSTIAVGEFARLT